MALLPLLDGGEAQFFIRCQIPGLERISRNFLLYSYLNGGASLERDIRVCPYKSMQMHLFVLLCSAGLVLLQIIVVAIYDGTEVVSSPHFCQ